MGANFPVSTSLNPRALLGGVSGQGNTGKLTESEAMEAIGEQLVNFSGVEYELGKHADSPFDIYPTKYTNGLYGDKYVPNDGQSTGFTEFYQDANGPARRLSGGANPKDGILELEEGVRNQGVFKGSRKYLIDVNDGTVWPDGRPKPQPKVPTQTAQGSELG